MQSLLKHETFLLIAIVTVVIGYASKVFFPIEGKMLAIAEVVILIAAILCASLSIAYHAEITAQKVGEPYGTMLLTLSSVLVEVLVLGIMTISIASNTLVRDSIYSAVMLDINGILGIAALIGGIKHGEQSYNDDSARTYSAMIMTAVGISMIVPEFVAKGAWQAYSTFTIVTMLLLYGVFLRMQAGPHSYFFSYSYPDKKGRKSPIAAANIGRVHSIAVMVGGIVVVGALAELLPKSLELGLQGIRAPQGSIALIVAVISATPEILTALRAALENRMQPAVNIAMGASLSTVVLTVPAMEALALYRGRSDSHDASHPGCCSNQP